VVVEPQSVATMTRMRSGDGGDFAALAACGEVMSAGGYAGG
jgi:hypothetical protein